jgi:DNA-binding CsgD family transcriptional regulator
VAGVTAEEIERVLGRLAVHVALLDEAGVIIDVNARWREFGAKGGLALPDGGIGTNYLRHCAFADEHSPRIVEGVTQLLSGKLQCFTFFYPCHSDEELRWFLLVGLPCGSGAAMLHVDVTSFLVLYMDGFPQADVAVATPQHGSMAGFRAALEKSMASAVGLRAQASAADGKSPAQGRIHDLLSKRQREVLDLLATGRSNAEIARALSISPNTVKIHVSEILFRLGLQSRAQAMLYALDQRPAAD